MKPEGALPSAASAAWAPAASETDAQASDFLVRRANAANWSESDEAALQAWLTMSVTNQVAFWRLESVWNRADRLSALLPLAPSDRRAKPKSRPRAKFLGLAVAAAIVLAIGASKNFLVFGPSEAVYATRVGGKETIRLADGSRIDLNTNTVIKTRFASGDRHVELVKGEALFQVQHDAAHPFVVLARGRRITDLGTKFLVREDGKRVRVALLEGSARITTANAKNNEKATILTPGDVAIADTTALAVTRRPQSDLEAELSWRRGVLIFHRATLDEVAREYNRYNLRKIVVTDQNAGARVINATLPSTDVDAFARMARNFLGLHVEKRGNTILISR